MNTVPIPSRLIEFLEAHDHFYIFSHVEPDGDCIGSSLALGSFLRRKGKSITYVNPGPFDRPEISPLAPLFESSISAAQGAGIVVDCSTLDRLGSVASQVSHLELAVIDHHSSGEDFGHIRWINTSSPATGLMIQMVIMAMGEFPTLEEAEHIFFAFATDTGFFRHLNDTSSFSFSLVSDLVKAGVSPKEMFHRVNGGSSFEAKKHLGLLLGAMEEYSNKRIILVAETLQMTQIFGRKNRESDTFYQQCMTIGEVEVVALLREDEDGSITGGLRSRSFLDVGSLAAEMGGGGHQRAAGFRVSGPLEEVKKRLLGLLQEAMRLI